LNGLPCGGIGHDGRHPGATDAAGRRPPHRRHTPLLLPRGPGSKAGEIFGNIWKYLEIFGTSWNYLEVVGNVLFPGLLEVHGISMACERV
jgi:hypothetical protein